MNAFSLDERGTVFAFRGLLSLAMLLLLAYSRALEETFSWLPLGLTALHFGTSFWQWRSRDARVHAAGAQAAAFLWDVVACAGVMFFSEGFDDELYLMFFLVLFMSALLTEVWHAFLIGGVACLLYAGLWASGKAAADLPAVNLALRFSFLIVTAFFTAVTAARAKRRETRLKSLELRLALERIANGGWTVRLDEDVDPEVAKSVKVVNAVLDNMEKALKRLVDQNEELRDAARIALAQLAHEKERVEATQEGAVPIETRRIDRQ